MILMRLVAMPPPPPHICVKVFQQNELCLDLPCKLLIPGTKLRKVFHPWHLSAKSQGNMNEFLGLPPSFIIRGASSPRGMEPSWADSIVRSFRKPGRYGITFGLARDPRPNASGCCAGHVYGSGKGRGDLDSSNRHSGVTDHSIARHDT